MEEGIKVKVEAAFDKDEVVWQNEHCTCIKVGGLRGVRIVDESLLKLADGISDMVLGGINPEMAKQSKRDADDR